jgi:hypothetical protein
VGKYDAAKEIIAKSFPAEQLVPQDANDWQGPFALPEEVLEYYRELGPCDLALEHIASTFFLPSLARLWEHQAGYRYHPDTKEVFPDWDDDWLVIADEGADPFIYVRSSGQILHDTHGGGSWNPEFFCQNLETMVTSMAILSELVLAAGESLEFEENGICKTWYDKAVARLTELLGNEIDAKGMLGALGWGEWH